MADVPEEIDPQTQSDAIFLLNVILDNEHWNNKGIREPDISVCFEMDACCQWGGAFSAARFKKALALLDGHPKVTKIGDRWYANSNRRFSI